MSHGGLFLYMDTSNVHFLSFSQCLKATPAEEGGKRYVYLEASNESVDQQGEIVLARALEESAEHYLKYGNIDLDHITQIGPKAGIADHHLYEIGRPVEVKIDNNRTFVKGQIIQGEGPVAAKANQFWESITEVEPPQRWYPSVGGSILEDDYDIDPETKRKRRLITKVRWTNIGLSRTPANSEVPEISVVPIGALAKCWGAGGLDITKALEAGYGSDSASLTGGGALRRQSLYGAPINYWDFRHQLSVALLRHKVSGSAGDLADYAVKEYGLSRSEAAEWVERFLRDLSFNYDKRKAS